MAFLKLAASAERTLYRVAGLPIAIRGLGGSGDPLREAFARKYFRPRNFEEFAELLTGILLSPLVLVLFSAWFTARNGAIIRRRYGRSLTGQLRDQLGLYFTNGILAPWYYIFSLHERGSERAPTFIQRFETKTCYFRLLKRNKGSPLNDKYLFARYCAARDLRCVPTELVLRGTMVEPRLPEADLFVKKITGRGGTGAERWDRIEQGVFCNPAGARLSAEQLGRQLIRRSADTPLLVQRRLQPHRALRRLTSGALPTVRILTCVNERGAPEIVAAMFRTSIGSNVTVDNLHAGGLGALVDIGSGMLSKSSNLGMDAQLGWHSAHPDTGERIKGRRLPCWEEAKMLALSAHHHFADRIVVGWDIAILDDGPIIVEGNGNPDLDILQRYMTEGLRTQRLGALIAYHMGRFETPAAERAPIGAPAGSAETQSRLHPPAAARSRM